MNHEPLFRRVTIRNKYTGEVRVIEGGDISHCASPIAPLLDSIKQSVGWIIPERHEELRALIASGISIELDGDSQDFYIAANVVERKVILGLAALERVWAYTYFYLAILDLLPKYPKGLVVDLRSLEEIQPARAVAKWALECEKNKTQSPWPDGLPRPDFDDGSDDRIRKAKPYFLHSVCFLMLHEVGHIHYNHPTSRFIDRETSYKWEFEADEWAADFMLRDWKSAGRREEDFIGRCTGISLGLAMLAGVELYHHAAQDDHPTIAERLLQFFAKHNPKSIGSASAVRDFPLYVASVILHGHFLNAGIAFEFTKVYEDITDYLIAAHRALAAHKDA
jgi:hypothetical protein